jgi:hypothetical protein
MKNFSKLLFLLLFFTIKLFPADSTQTDKNLINVFIDCHHCDMNYIRTEITFINYVMDRKNADLHILVTRQHTGSNGREYTLSFIGRKKFINKNDTLSFFTQPDNSDDEVRRKMVNTLKLGLIRYVAATEAANNINITYNSNGAEKQSIVDPWDYWVFRTRLHGYFRGEESYTTIFLNASMNVNRITENWKFKSSFSSYYTESNFSHKTTQFSSYTRSNIAEVLLVKSISNHWSLGGNTRCGNSTYMNYKIFAEIAPAIEYNIYPYSESTRKIFRILYQVGYAYAQFNEMTIYDKLEDAKFKQSLEVALEIKQPWGTVETSIEGSNFFYDFSKNRLEMDVELSLRLFKGFTLDIDGGYSLIHDQLNIPKSDISDEEVLLRRRQLETQYEFYTSIGVSYTFGSIYNNIVNPRFGN